MIMNSYIVHVYDQPKISDIKQKSVLMSGIIEDVDTGMKYTFHNKDELWEFMAEHQDELSTRCKQRVLST